jgi:hypothetical protein
VRSALLLLLWAATGAEARTGEVPATLGPAEARASADRALEWLLLHQNPDGSWASGALEGVLELGYSIESFYCWQVAASALACLALLSADETPARRAALERGLRWLETTRSPKRGSDWDIDFVWAGLFGLVAASEAATDARFGSAEWEQGLRATGLRYLSILAANQEPNGGFGYYDDRIYSRRPKWATSFSTACVLPALKQALELGWLGDAGLLERARRYVSRCALPNGAFAYDLRPVPRLGGESIDDVKGALGRIQVCHWALHVLGEPKITTERLRDGLESFFVHHRFLDVARMRPIPHEAYYYNAGYFYLFGHFYAAQVIERLPAAEREGWHARLRPHLVKVQRADGSTSDFLDSGYSVVAGTAFLALALELGLPPLAPAER